MHNGAPDALPKPALLHGMQGTVRSLPPKLLRVPPAPRFQVWLHGKRPGGRVIPWEQTTHRSGEDMEVGDGQEGQGLATEAGEV